MTKAIFRRNPVRSLFEKRNGWGKSYLQVLLGNSLVIKDTSAKDPKIIHTSKSHRTK